MRNSHCIESRATSAFLLLFLGSVAGIAQAQTALPSSNSGSPVSLSTFGTGNPFTVANGVTIFGNGASQVILGNNSNTWDLTNSGTIQQSSPSFCFNDCWAVRFDAGGKMTNTSAGIISGDIGGVSINANGTVDNSGTIQTLSTVSPPATTYGAISFTSGTNVVINRTGGLIRNTTSGGRAITTAGGTVTITNDGTIESVTGTTATAINLAQGGAVTNQDNGIIRSSGSAIVIAGAAGTVTNDGQITGNAVGAGAFGIALNAGGTVTNNASGSITGTSTTANGGYAVRIQGASGTINNYGEISTFNPSGQGVGLLAGGTLNNYGSGTIQGTNGNTVSGGAGSAAVNNWGEILGVAGNSYDALQLTNGGTITNYTGGLISGGDRGIYLVRGGTLVNEAGATIEARSANVPGNFAGGVWVGNTAGNYAADITNDGTITAVVSPGIVFYGANSGQVITGTVTNGATGVISGSSGIVFTNTDASVVWPQGTVTNLAGGKIEGTSGTGVWAQSAPLSLTNDGEIEGALVGVELDQGGEVINQSNGQIVSDGVGVIGDKGVTVDSSGIITAASNFEAVLFLSGNNELFLRSGSKTTGIVQMGLGNDQTTVYAGADIDDVPLFHGGGAGDTLLTFDGYAGAARAIAAWKDVVVTNSAKVTLDGADIHQAGMFRIDTGASLGFSTQTGTLTGDVTNAGTLDYTAGNGSGAYMIVGNVANTGGLINLSNATWNTTVGTVGDKLTIRGNYIGTDGTVVLDTFLGTDGSPSDVLVIDGGTASGNTFLTIKNTNIVAGVGAGALTLGNGILVVDAINNATTAPGSFSLAGPVYGGPYEYKLFRGPDPAGNDPGGGNDEAWYLRSTLATFNCTLDPTDPSCVNYRPETGLYNVLPSMFLGYSSALLDTLHERVGDEHAGARPRENESIGWTRLIGMAGKAESGPAKYRHHTWA
ncbi:MAG: hypothetical protein LBE33_00070, partial [Zoogloeaceae bacterium]|nr:hypothetical protein [Zoogloeaceae bacterium]